MNEFSITPFRGLHLILLLLTAAAVLLLFLPLRGKPEARRSRYLIGVCFFKRVVGPLAHGVQGGYGTPRYAQKLSLLHRILH